MHRRSSTGKQRRPKSQFDELELDITPGVIRVCTADNKPYVGLETAHGLLEDVIESLKDWAERIPGEPVTDRAPLFSDVVSAAQRSIFAILRPDRSITDPDIEEDLQSIRVSMRDRRSFDPEDVVAVLTGIKKKIRDQMATSMFDCMILRGF